MGRTDRKSRSYMVVSMAIFGTIGPFTRVIPVSSGELALYRAVLASLMLAGYLAVKREPIDVKAVKKELGLLLLSGMAMGINWVLLFQAYQYTTISAATLSYYFAPVIVTAVSPVLFREKLTGKGLLCFLMSTLGLVLIIGPEGGAGKGIFFGLGAAVFYAGVMLMNKRIRGVKGLHRTVVQFLGAILVLIPYVAFTGGVRLEGMDPAAWVCLLVVGFVHTGVTYCMYFSALKELPGQTAAILSYIDPLVAVLVSFFILGEEMGPLQWLGGALVLGFAVWNEKE